VSHIDELGRLLVRLEVITKEQWQDACLGAGRSQHFSDILDSLAQTRAWWSPGGAFVPALGEYQRGRIERELTAPKNLRRALGRTARSLRVNNYLLLKEYRGGMGIVYKAWSLFTRQFVAVKKVSQDTPELRARLKREARVLKRLDHRSIAGFHSFEKSKRGHLLVQEFVEGVTVDEAVNKHGPVRWRDAVRWGIDLLAALEYAHARGVLHRDIKPSNVMLEPTRAGYMVKLCDLGLAKETGSTDGLSRTGVLIGTKEYLSPEHSEGPEKIVAASDIYGLGCTLFFMLAGRPPFVFGNGAVSPYVHAHASSPPPRVSEFNPEVPPALTELIDHMLRKDPAARGTAGELREEFQRVLEGLPLLRVPEEAKPEGAPLVESPELAELGQPGGIGPYPRPEARFIDEEPVAEAARLARAVALGLGELVLWPVRLLFRFV
jgi:serine/threonine-protein kinase